MKINKKYFFIIIAILMLSFFSASISSFATDAPSKTVAEISVEKDMLKKDKDDKIITSSFFVLANFHNNSKNHIYLQIHHSYLDTNQLLRPPIFI